MPMKLLKGSAAVAEGAIQAGCRHYYGYPITPQSEILHYMSARMPEAGGVFIQAESEIAAINMVYGTACTGARAMTSTSGPGTALMSETLSFSVAAGIPVVVVTAMRTGPGIGNVLPEQSDYLHLTKSAGHGNSYNIVLAPSSVQETMDMTRQSFDLAETYRIPVIVAIDSLIVQTMETVHLEDDYEIPDIPKPWATNGARGRSPNYINPGACYSIEQMHGIVSNIENRFEAIKEKEPRAEQMRVEDADVLIVAFGTAARFAQAAVRMGREQGVALGLFRPLTLWPFPIEQLQQAAQGVKAIYVVELNLGQMVDDVRLFLDCQVPVHLSRSFAGSLPVVSNIVSETSQLAQA